MSYAPESLPLTYRPRTFEHVVGQDAIVDVLRAMVSRHALPPQILFSGPSGTGKTTLARLTAAAVLCETPMEQRDKAEPCQSCEACQEILSSSKTHPDVMEIDAASNGRVDEIRELASVVQLTPAKADFRIVIIDEVHGLTGAGGNAFLKLLEEPPEHVIFLLATTDPDKMLTTNRSRVTELPLARPPRAALMQNLKRVADAKGWTLSKELAAAIVDATDPALGVRGTLMTLQKVSPTLDNGTTDPSTAFALLGAASPSLVDSIRQAYMSGDRRATLSAASDAIHHATEQTVARALLRAARQDLQDAVQSGDDQRTTVALADHHVLTEATRDVQSIEATLVRLALARPTPEQAETETSDPKVEAFVTKVEQSSQEAAVTLRSANQLVLDGNALVITAPEDLLQTLRMPPHGPVLAAVGRQAGLQLKPNPVPTLS